MNERSSSKVLALISQHITAHVANVLRIFNSDEG